MANRSENQPIFIGPSSSPATSSTVAAFNESTLTYEGQLGMKYRVGDKWYQLVKLYASNTLATANGAVAFWQDKSNFVVTATIAQSYPNRVAGLFLGVITAGNYCFIQIEGVHTNAILTAAAAANVNGLVALADTAASGFVVALAINSQRAGMFPQWPPVGHFKDTAISGVATVEVMLRNG